MNWIIILTSVLVILLRFTVPDRPVFTWWGSYEAFAHIWVGILVRQIVLDVKYNGWRFWKVSVALWTLAIITVIEVIAAKT